LIFAAIINAGLALEILNLVPKLLEKGIDVGQIKVSKDILHWNSPIG
jgi:hypothetical protein